MGNTNSGFDEIDIGFHVLYANTLLVASRISRIKVIGNSWVNRPHLSKRMHDYFVCTEGEKCRSTIGPIWNDYPKELSKFAAKRNKTPRDSCVSAITTKVQIQVF